MEAPLHLGEHTILDEYPNLGKDVFIGNFVHIMPNVSIGDGSKICDYVFVAEGAKIGKKTRILQFSNICRGAVIGDECFLAVGVILTNDRKQSYPYGPDTWTLEPVIIEDKVRVGSGAVILAGVTLKEGSQIGAGAVVTRDTQPGETYVGNPAKLIVRQQEKHPLQEVS